MQFVTEQVKQVHACQMMQFVKIKKAKLITFLLSFTGGIKTASLPVLRYCFLLESLIQEKQNKPL